MEHLDKIALAEEKLYKIEHRRESGANNNIYCDQVMYE